MFRSLFFANWANYKRLDIREWLSNVLSSSWLYSYYAFCSTLDIGLLLIRGRNNGTFAARNLRKPTKKAQIPCQNRNTPSELIAYAQQVGPIRTLSYLLRGHDIQFEWRYMYSSGVFLSSPLFTVDPSHVETYRLANSPAVSKLFFITSNKNTDPMCQPENQHNCIWAFYLLVLIHSPEWCGIEAAIT